MDSIKILKDENEQLRARVRELTDHVARLLSQMEEMEGFTRIRDEHQKEFRKIHERLDFSWVGSLGRWDWDYETGKVIYNDKKPMALGYAPGEIEPDVYGWTTMIHPDDYDRTMEQMRLHLKGELPTYDVEYRIRHKDGSYRWFYDSGKVIEWQDDGRPKRIVGLVFDITERKEMELERERLISELSRKIDEIERLKGIIPVCSSCHKVRDDDGYWQKVEEYLEEHTDAQVYDSICPDCMKKINPELYNKLQKDDD